MSKNRVFMIDKICLLMKQQYNNFEKGKYDHLNDCSDAERPLSL